MAKSEIPFTRLFIDQALEQEIKKLKGHSGMVGLSRDEAALDRLVIATPHLARLVNQYLSGCGFPNASRSSVRREHYQLSRDCFEVKSKCSEDWTDNRAALWRLSIRSKHTIEESGIISASVRRGKAKHSAIHGEGLEVLWGVSFAAFYVHIESLCGTSWRNSNWRLFPTG